MATTKRRQLFVDPKVQGAFAWRGCIYCTICLLVLIFAHRAGKFVRGAAGIELGSDYSWAEYAPVLFAYVLMLPVLVIDMARLSNRWAGPLVRLRSAIRTAARGERPEPIKFRGSDFWQDLSNEFNQLCGALPVGERPVPASPKSLLSEQPAGQPVHS